MSDRPVDPLQPLSRRIRDGDIAAFESLFRALHAPLCEIVDGYVRSQAIAEEIVQDLFFVLWVGRERFPEARSMRAYMFTAARNRAVHHLRHRAVAKRWTERSLTDTSVALPGRAETSGGVAAFFPGLAHRVVVSAVDANYYDYYRRSSDFFSGLGIISHLDGAIGVFGSIAPVASYSFMVR